MAADALPLTGLKVLVAEDEVSLAIELEQLVGELGGTVIGPVGTVAAAIEQVRREHLDGALLDIELRDGRVSPIAAILAARGVPFVLLSGYDPLTLQDDPVLRAAPQLAKPFGFQAFLEVICRTMSAAMPHSGRP
jgi:DNA-binding NtrC family response regulator